MRILINGILYDSTKTPILIVFDENEKDLMDGRYVSAPNGTPKEVLNHYLDIDIESEEIVYD